MERRKQLGIYLVLLMLLFGVFQLFIISCAGSLKALSPEEQKAFQDSLNEVHRLNVLKTFSSGFEHYRHGNYERAKPYLRRTADIDTTNIYGKTVYQHLGRTYIFLNMPDSAEWAFKEGKSRDPEKIFYYTSLGYLFEKQGRTDDAISEYEAIVKIAPDSAAYHSKLGKIYAVNGDNDLAIASLQKAIRLNPDDKDSQEILDKLFLQTGDLNEIITQREYGSAISRRHETPDGSGRQLFS